MTNRDDELAVLSRGLDQAAGLLGEVTDADLAATTSCEEWTGAELVDHLVAAPARFARLVRGEEVDWSAPTPPAGGDPVAAFREAGGELLRAWQDLGDGEAPVGPDWQSAEVAVHTWDLATTLGRPTDDLDPEVAERGLAFMQANLKPEIRGPAFGPEQPAPDGADAYQRIAAFAGRRVGPTDSR
jgi:uncharacterized protein (TIGR03086 family)